MRKIFGMKCWMFYLVILMLLVTSITATIPQSYLSTADKTRITSMFDSTLLSKELTDVKSVALSVMGSAILEVPVSRKTDICDLFKRVMKNGLATEKEAYFAAEGANALGDCSLDGLISQETLALVSNPNSLSQLSRTVQTLNRLKLPLPTGLDVMELIEKWLRKDSGAINQAYAFIVAAELVTDKQVLQRLAKETEDVLQQADEAEGKLLYYEDGLWATAHIINGIFAISNKLDLHPAVPIDKLGKFANYLLSRRYTEDLDDVIEMIAALNVLSKNKWAVPVVVSAVNGGIIDGPLRIRLTTVLGDTITEGLTAVADTVKAIEKDVTIIAKKSFVATSDGVLELDMTTTEGQPSRGYYSVSVRLTANDSRYGGGNALILGKVLTDIQITDTEISVKERDQITGAQTFKLPSVGATLSDVLVINWHHRMDLSFIIRDGQQMPMRPHQVFVRMVHSVSKQEIIFVVEADSNGLYKFSLDLEKSGKDFDNLSGDYQIQLIIGDALIRKSAQWTIGLARLEMPGQPSSPTEATADATDARRSVAGAKRSSPSPRIGDGPAASAKPEIFHQFRPAEKRGGQMISAVFTCLCVFPPAIILLLLWTVGVGINVGNFLPSVSALMFHTGLAAIFGLYYCYWLHLDMFTTLQYLLPLGAGTAFFGNRVLRCIASVHK